ncbi:MAG TPA: universal stress protein [Stellaceae bacterium]|jgi:nucleotide-binding universal stress UspA family protein|nr:universal stress protein [Stellaceae bacterium]
MSIRTILAAASGGAATSGVIDLACQLARRFEAHLEGFHVLPDPSAAFAASGEGIGSPAPVGLVDRVIEEAAATAARTRALFEEIAHRHGIAHGALPQAALRLPLASWREETGNAAALVARRGRCFDLVVLGRSDRVVNEPYSDTIEVTLAQSGRPVLLAPAEPPSGIGYVVAVAWNGSPQAVRALAASLPFLEKANAVSLITAGDADPDDARPIIDYLAWHGVAAEPHTVAAVAGRHGGRVLLDAARDAAADLLVMGAYGRAPWREQLFGGATRAVLATMPLPLLLMH